MDQADHRTQNSYSKESADLFSLERKVRVGFALAAAVLIFIGIGALTYISVVRFAEDARSLDHTHQVLNSLSELVSSLTSTESVQLGNLLTGSEDYPRSFEAAVIAADQQLGRLRKLTPDNPNQQSKLTALEPVAVQRVRLMRERLDLRRSQGFEAAQAITGEGKEIQDEILEWVRSRKAKKIARFPSVKPACN